MEYPEFRIIARDGAINDTGILRKKGDVIRLSPQQLMHLRGMVEPVDDAGKDALETLDKPKQTTDLSNFRPHEQEEMLAAEEAELKARFEAIQRQRADIKASAAQSAAPAAPQPPAAPRPPAAAATKPK